MEINIYSTGLDYGDGVSNEIILMQKSLTRLGYKSKIYTNIPNDKLECELYPIKKYAGSPDNILIIQHAYFLDEMDLIKMLPDKKILRYQNITPATFFSSSYEMVKAIKLGAFQTEQLLPYIDLAMPASRFSVLESMKYGYDTDIDLQIILDLSKFNINAESVNSEEYIAIKNRLSNFENVFIAVGRVVRNKNQFEIVRAFNAMQPGLPKNPALFLVGNDLQDSRYANKIRKYIIDNKLSDKVFLTGKVSDRELAAYFNNANTIVNYSDHEGFCIPLIEGFYNKLNVIAKATTSIPYVLGDSGILVRNFYELCQALVTVCDAAKSEAIIAKQNIRLLDFDLHRAETRLRSILEKIGRAKYHITFLNHSSINIAFLDKLEMHSKVKGVSIIHKSDLSLENMDTNFAYFYERAELNKRPDFTIQMFENGANLIHKTGVSQLINIQNTNNADTFIDKIIKVADELSSKNKLVIYINIAGTQVPTIEHMKILANEPDVNLEILEVPYLDKDIDVSAQGILFYKHARKFNQQLRLVLVNNPDFIVLFIDQTISETLIELLSKSLTRQGIKVIVKQV